MSPCVDTVEWKPRLWITRGKRALSRSFTQSGQCKHAIVTCNKRLRAAGCTAKDVHVKQHDMKKLHAFQRADAAQNSKFNQLLKSSGTILSRYFAARDLCKIQKWMRKRSYAHGLIQFLGSKFVHRGGGGGPLGAVCCFCCRYIIQHPISNSLKWWHLWLLSDSSNWDVHLKQFLIKLDSCLSCN